LKKIEIKKEKKQTNPPSIPVSKLFSGNAFPIGEIQDYSGSETNTKRKSDTEKKKLDKFHEKHYADARRASEVHRQVRQYIQGWVKPGMKMIDICEELESKVRTLVEVDGIKQGIAFPTGCSLNHCAAHWTPNPGDKTVLQTSDVVKFDFGVHVGGRIIDSAFTMCFEDQFKPLLKAVKEATNMGIKTAGIDVRLGDIGAAIQEVMESHEVEINKKVYKVKCVRNLNGHSIDLYRIHAGKTVPIIKSNDNNKMEENEFYAIETFGTTGNGIVRDDTDCSHFMKAFVQPTNMIKHPGARKLLPIISKEFSTLAFCRRYLDRIGQKDHLMALRSLVNEGFVDDYPPLCDIKGSYVAQYEHTLILRPTCKEILSRGNDY